MTTTTPPGNHVKGITPDAQPIRYLQYLSLHEDGIRRVLVEIRWEERFITGQLQAIARFAADPEHSIVTVAVNEAGAEAQVIGFATLEWYAWNNLAQIHGLAVAPGARRRGIARTLVEIVEDFARRRGARGVYVDTPVGNIGGRDFYEAGGYTFAYCMPEYYGPGDDGVTYRKQLHHGLDDTDAASVAKASGRAGTAPPKPAPSMASEPREGQSAVDGLLGSRAPLVRDLVGRLCKIPGMVAIALGGSYASGTAHADSDIDLGLYYHEAAPFSIEAVRQVANAVNDSPNPTVADFGGWGKWPNGGAWLTVGGQRVDFIYRSVDRLQHWIGESMAGEFTQDYYVQQAYGFRSYMYLGELQMCRPLYDPAGALAQMKALVASYPPALKAEVMRTWLECAPGDGFKTLYKAAHRGDLFMTAGCITRTVAMLAQVLFALNETYFVTDKGTLERIDAFALRPDGYGITVRDLLAHPGTTSAELMRSVARLEDLYWQVVDLCQEWYPSTRLAKGSAK